MGGSISNPPESLSTFESPCGVLSSAPARRVVLSGMMQLEVRASDLLPLLAVNKWVGPWPPLNSSVFLLLSSSLPSPWSRSTTHDRKRKGTSFPSTLLTDPFASPPWRTRGKEWEWEWEPGWDRTGHLLELKLQELLGPSSLPHCPQHLLTLPALEERTITAACILQPYYNLCA